VSAARTVLVTDAEQRAALAVVRSLGRAGYRVLVGSSERAPLAGASRHAAGSVLLPDPCNRPDEYAAAAARAAHDAGADTLLPVSEASLLNVLPARDVSAFGLNELCIPYPPYETFSRLADKLEVVTLATRLGVAVPEQRVISSAGDIPAVEFPFPVVVKPSRSVSVGPGRRKRFGVAFATDQIALERLLQDIGPDAYPVLLQRKIDGPGCGIFLLLWDGEVRAQFAHRRLLEKPATGGVSVYSESVIADPLLVEHSLALLGAVGWQGLAMVEFKLDRASDTPYLMEINGRFWGSLQLAIDAGVDFPSLLLKVASGSYTETPRYKVGARLRWWWGEVDRLATGWRSPQVGNVALRERLAMLRGVLTPSILRGARNEVFRFADPGPFVCESSAWIRSAFGSR
jgi:predicted ATP-grasp superfamily ATP-dependent carboligase